MTNSDDRAKAIGDACRRPLGRLLVTSVSLILVQLIPDGSDTYRRASASLDSLRQRMQGVTTLPEECVSEYWSAVCRRISEQSMASYNMRVECQAMLEPALGVVGAEALQDSLLRMPLHRLKEAFNSVGTVTVDVRWPDSSLVAKRTVTLLEAARERATVQCYVWVLPCPLDSLSYELAHLDSIGFSARRVASSELLTPDEMRDVPLFFEAWANWFSRGSNSGYSLVARWKDGPERVSIDISLRDLIGGVGIIPDRGNPLDWSDARYSFMLPVAEVWKDVKSMDISQAVAVLESLAKRSEGAIVVGGVSVPRRYIGLVGGVALLYWQLTLWRGLVRARRYRVEHVDEVLGWPFWETGALRTVLSFVTMVILPSVAASAGFWRAAGIWQSVGIALCLIVLSVAMAGWRQYRAVFRMG